MRRSLLRGAALAGLLLAFAVPARAGVQITIVNGNAAGVGFNDPTPATPVGGNTGTTVGAQRLQAFQYAAGLWSALLEGDVAIQIQASFDPLDCTATTGTLGAAGPTMALSDFPGAPEPHTWYAAALASRIAGTDLVPGSAAEIRAQFNSNVGTANCLASTRWYYGLDNQHGNAIDLVSVLLHEFGHGLGFLTFVDSTTGEEFQGQPDVYEKHVRDDSVGTTWDAMSAAERQASAIRTGSVAWDSPRVNAMAPAVLAAMPTLSVDAPAAIAGEREVGTADFGGALTAAGVTGPLVAAEDPSDVAGPSGTDACSPLTNAAAVAGRIALVDRGTCVFTDKARHVQAAGAIGLVVANNVADPTALFMGGSDDAITIPLVSITQADGATLRANLAAGVTATLRLDPSRHAGMDPGGRVLLYAPDPVDASSSISHWDSSAFPHLLMQPSLASDLTHQVDLTLPMLQDLGWSPIPTAPRDEVQREGPEAPPRKVGPRP